MTIDLTSATKRMVDLSTAHMTRKDNELFQEIMVAGCTALDLPRMSAHEHGVIIFLGGSQPDTALAMAGYGFSVGLVHIYMAAEALGSDVMLLNFDSAADVIEGLPTFDW